MSRPAVSAEAPADTGWLDLVRRHVGSLRYGVVQIVVHDGQVTQIEKTERVRYDHRVRAVTQATASKTTINA